MSASLFFTIIAFACMFVWLLVTAIQNKIKEKKIQKRITEGRTLLSKGEVRKMLNLAQNKAELAEMIHSTEEFLSAIKNQPAEEYIKLLKAAELIEIHKTTVYKRQYSRSCKTEYSCAPETTAAIYDKIKECIRKEDTIDLLALYYLFYNIRDNFHKEDAAQAAREYCILHKMQLFNPDISVAYFVFQSATSLPVNKQDESESYYSDAELSLFGKSGYIRRRRSLNNYVPAGNYQSAIIKGHSLRFYPEPHIYFIDGIEVPSVTQLLKQMDESYADYSGISKAVLDNAARKGTALHAAIQAFEETGKTNSSIEFQHYLMLKEENRFLVDECEKFVIVFYRNTPVCAGKFDLLIKMNGEAYLADIKRTSTYHKNDVEKQLNLYRIGYQQSYNKSIEGLYCLHLRESVYAFKKVSIKENETVALIEKYYKQNY